LHEGIRHTIAYSSNAEQTFMTGADMATVDRAIH
jgi:hypothetical protein